MNSVVKASLVLVGLVALLSIVLQVTGLNSNFMLSQQIFLIGAIAINVAAVVWALSQTAATTTYGGQLMNAAKIGVIGGALITLVSWFLLAIVFPDSISEMAEAAKAWMETQDFTPEKTERQLEVIENTTPMSQSIPGGLGTFVTSIVTGAIAGFFKRKK